MQSNKAYKEKLEPIHPQENPLLFVDKPALFFLGIATFLKNNQETATSRFFHNLACYVEPYQPKVWDESIALEKNIGNFTRAFILLKTAFLFKRFSNYAIDYLQTGDKCGASMHDLRGLLRSLRCPAEFEKVII